MPDNQDFASFKATAAQWITLAEGAFYPDDVANAVALYLPVFQTFEELLDEASDSADLLTRIAAVTDVSLRTQLCRVFKKFVSPQTPVEMLKVKAKIPTVIADFGAFFRPISEVRVQWRVRRVPDETLAMLLWEYKDRGKRGYDLSEAVFATLRAIDLGYVITGPERAGRDVLLGEILPDYPKPDRPVDFVIKEGSSVLAIGLIRYDSDRGGAQEDDRIGQYREVAQEIFGYAATNDWLATTKVVFVNDGPGLLLGSMWDDYSYLEGIWNGRVKVATLKMLPVRLTAEWLHS